MKRWLPTVSCLLGLCALFLLALVPLDEVWASGGHNPDRQTVPYTRTPVPPNTNTPIPPTATTRPNATPTIADLEVPPARATATSTATTTATATSTATATPGVSPTGAPGSTPNATTTPLPLGVATADAGAQPTRARTPVAVVLTSSPETPGEPLPTAMLAPDDGAPGAGTIVLCCGGILGLSLSLLGMLIRRRRADELAQVER